MRDEERESRQTRFWCETYAVFHHAYVRVPITMCFLGAFTFKPVAFLYMWIAVVFTSNGEVVFRGLPRSACDHCCTIVKHCTGYPIDIHLHLRWVHIKPNASDDKHSTSLSASFMLAYRVNICGHARAGVHKYPTPTTHLLTHAS